MIDHFYTIKKKGSSLYKEKGSKFIGYAFPVRSLEQVNQQLESLRKEHHDARHHCYAYKLGDAGDQTRANDDGEPNHSAGDPILGQIKSLSLTYTLIVVVRYFGGTKLGVSGLISAYKTAAEEALKNSIIHKEFITHTIKLSYAYSCTNEVMKLIDTHNLSIVNQEFKEKCFLEAIVVISKLSILKKEIQLLIDTHHDIEIIN